MAENDQDEQDEEVADDVYLSDEEMNLVVKARELDNPTLIESDVEALSADVEQFDEPALIEKAQYEKHNKRVAEIRNRLGEALIETTDLRAETVSALSFDALWDEFTDDGDDTPDIAVLTQTPEAGGIGEDEEEGPTADDVDEIESKLSRADMMERHAPDHAESLRSDAADMAGVESHEDIDLEVL